jgi:hypothetical protein
MDEHDSQMRRLLNRRQPLIISSIRKAVRANFAVGPRLTRTPLDGVVPSETFISPGGKFAARIATTAHIHRNIDKAVLGKMGRNYARLSSVWSSCQIRGVSCREVVLIPLALAEELQPKQNTRPLASNDLLDGQHVFRELTNATERFRADVRSLIDRRLGITADISTLD